MQFKVFVDGQAGTTGLKIHQRLARRSDLDLLRIEDEKRKDLETRRALLNEADVVFLCLPDAAAVESVSLIENANTRVIDASTAHRVDPDWTYGLPELGAGRKREIANAKRVSVPGCHATGFILLLYPLVKAGIVPRDYPVCCHSITGYSGGGKPLIERYRTAEESGKAYVSPRHYALGLNHKHLPEMQQLTGLVHPPLFTPIVGNFYQGMVVAIPLCRRLLSKTPTAKDIHAVLASFYANQRFVTVIPYESEAYLEAGYLDAMACNDSNRAELFVFGRDDQILLLARFDNLGKGSSGAAVQCMNIMLGLDEGIGLAQ
ncbi:MAG: N-acetyl-gamma-glutamyl-phosphate reductase [Bacteroidota bacterium]